MANLSAPRVVERIIKPHAKTDEDVRLIVCNQEGNCWYEDMSTFTWNMVGLTHYLRSNWPRTKGRSRVKVVLICHNPHKILSELEAEFTEDPNWNVRITLSEGESHEDEGCTFYRKEKTRIAFFGFRVGKRTTQYIYPISSLEFLESLDAYRGTELEKLYEFGDQLRTFCKDNELKIGASRGSISSQLLKDERFYPHARRKVPRLTNEAARPALPGNCYQVTERNIERFFKGVYVIDQQNAHHHAAETVLLPNANDLFAYGWYFNQSDDEWLNYRDPLFQETLDNEHGLFRVRASIPRHLSGYLPPWCRAHGDITGKSTIANLWLYSNEIHWAKTFGIQIRSISRWYGSLVPDRGISAYSIWAQNQVRLHPNQKAWLKPTLLSAYGLLGARPRYMESGYKNCEKGNSHTYIIGAKPYSYKQVKSQRKIQPPTANIIQQGMIQAETRKLSIELARQLEHEGHNVIRIHADAVLVEDTEQQLPLLPPPWRVKDRLTNFQAIDAISFVSDELEILPGRPRTGKGKRNRRMIKNGNVRQRQNVRA